MDGAQIAVGLSALAAMGTVYNGWLANRAKSAADSDVDSRERLQLAWEMSEKHSGRQDQRISVLEHDLGVEKERNLHLDTQLQECKRGRHQLEVQVEILRLQFGGGSGSNPSVK